MSYTGRPTRSVRRAKSRDEARANLFLGVAGQREGAYPAEIVWRKHVPINPTCSGQTRVNHKRNVRARFWADFHEKREAVQWVANEIYTGLVSIDEVRAELELAPWGLSETSA